MTIRCAIIDDEPLAGGLLESYVEKTPCLELIGTYTSALAAMRDLRDDPAQLIFLDIQMPELSGIEFTKILARLDQTSHNGPPNNKEQCNTLGNGCFELKTKRVRVACFWAFHPMCTMREWQDGLSMR